MLGVGGLQQTSAMSTPVGLDGKISRQISGTTLARQFTGLGGGVGAEPGLLKQLTGGSISTTRSLSPTKQYNTSIQVRPKSAIGMRNSKSIDEGRGMFLVKQLTGPSVSNQWEV